MRRPLHFSRQLEENSSGHPRGIVNHSSNTYLGRIHIPIVGFSFVSLHDFIERMQPNVTCVVGCALRGCNTEVPNQDTMFSQDLGGSRSLPVCPKIPEKRRKKKKFIRPTRVSTPNARLWNIRFDSRICMWALSIRVFHCIGASLHTYNTGFSGRIRQGLLPRKWPSFTCGGYNFMKSGVILGISGELAYTKHRPTRLNSPNVTRMAYRLISLFVQGHWDHVHVQGYRGCARVFINVTTASDKYQYYIKGNERLTDWMPFLSFHATDSTPACQLYTYTGGIGSDADGDDGLSFLCRDNKAAGETVNELCHRIIVLYEYSWLFYT